MVVCLTGPRRHWVVLGSFIPRLYSGTLISRLFGLNDFTNSNARFSQWLPPGEPLPSRWSPAPPETFEDTLRCSLENLCSSLLRFPSTVNPYGKLHTLAIHTIIPRCSCYYKMPQNSLLFRESFELTALQFFAPWIPPLRIIPRTHRGFVHPQLFVWFSKFFEILSDLPKILSNLLLLKFLFACIMVNSIFQVIFIDILCHYPFESVDSICCGCSQSSVGS